MGPKFIGFFVCVMKMLIFQYDAAQSKPDGLHSWTEISLMTNFKEEQIIIVNLYFYSGDQQHDTMVTYSQYLC